MVATSWKALTSQADCDELMKRFGGFHDGCIREAHVWAESFVDTELNMSCTGDLDTRVRIFVQRQSKDPTAIELLFEQVVTLHLQPSPENYDSIIFGATMLHKNGAFYWSDVEGWSLDSSARDDATWIAAKKLSWRDVSEWMGPNFRYGPGSVEI